jgi:hypothetical protein
MMFQIADFSRTGVLCKRDRRLVKYPEVMFEIYD